MNNEVAELRKTMMLFEHSTDTIMARLLDERSIESTVDLLNEKDFDDAAVQIYCKRFTDVEFSVFETALKQFVVDHTTD